MYISYVHKEGAAVRIGVARAREHFKEMLDRVGAGELIEITRRGEVIAVLAPPSARHGEGESFADTVHAWRTAWDVESWSNDDPFADVRDRGQGREAPW